MSDRPRSRGRHLATRFLLYYALVYFVLIGLMGVVIERTTRETLIEEAIEGLELEARLAARSVPSDPADYPEWAAEISEMGSLRTTLIATNGLVLADSHSDPAVMENHQGRPEVATALAGDVGVSRRISASTGFEQLYVALPPEDGQVVRLSVPTGVIDTGLGRVRTSIIVTVVIIGVIGIGVVALLTRRMSRPIVELTEQSLEVASGRLDVSPRRSPVAELDQLGLAISRMAENLGTRILEAERATSTLEMVLGAIPQGTILVDADDRVVYANPAAHEMLGSVGESLGQLSPLPLQNAVRASRERRQQDVRAFDHGKPARRLRAMATPFDSRVLLVVVDITDRERTDSIRRDFVANASHELKTPVSTIIASAEALQIALSRRDGTAAGFAGRIEESARQLDRLVGDLLDLSRLERETLELIPVRLDFIVRDEVERVRTRADEKSIYIDVEAVELTVEGSHRDLAVALRNLLDNAIRYTGEGGTVTVTLSENGDGAALTVADSGDGIPTRDHDRVFERFYRVDSARSRDTGGTGLGLSIVKHVAEGHGGSVNLESELGVGSRFTIRLPWRRDL